MVTSVLDYFTNKTIKLKFPISNSDTLNTIKEKIFISSDNFISLNTLAISDSTKYIIDDSQLKQSSVNFVAFNLVEELTKYIFKDIQKFLNISINSQIISSLYNGYKGVYINLSRNTLYYTVLYVLSQTLNMQNYELTAWLREQQVIKNNLIEKYTALSNVKKFNPGDYLHQDKKGYLYSVINTIVYYTLEISKNQKGTLMKILKEYPLNNDIPIMLITEDKVNPAIKIYKDFSNEKIAEWYLKKGENSFKKTRGLVFKMKIADDNYANVMLVPENNKISIRCSWTSTNNIRYEDIMKSIGVFNKFIDITQSRITPDIIIKEPIIGYINVQFTLKKQIPLPKIALASKQFVGIFKLDEKEKKKEFIKLVYQPENITLIFRYTNVTNDNVTSTYNSIDVLGIKSERQLIHLMETVARLVSKAEEQKDLLIFKDYKYQKVSNEKLKDKPIPNLNIKKLKQEGIPIDTVSCQKERQPKIVSDSDFVYKGNKIACTNKPYIYPGFTNKDILCCFKKDQRHKPAYIRNVSNNVENIELIDSKILKKRIITTDKILDANRLGILPDVLDTIFNTKTSKSYFRLGFPQNTDTLHTILKTVSKATSKKTDNLEEMYKVNIFIFNMLTNSVSCKDNLHMPYNNTVFLIKNGNTYEQIIKRNGNSIKRTFNKNEDIKLINEILDVYKKSCIVKYSDTSILPLNFVELLSKGIEITSQVTSPFNKVIYVNTKEYGVLPVLPTKPITNIKSVNINDIKLNPDEQIAKLKKLNINYIELTGQIMDGKYTTGLVTKSGLIIPTRKDVSKSKLPIVYRQFVNDIDTLIYNKTPGVDKRYQYMLSVKYHKELYNKLKYILSKVITKEIKDTILLAINSVKNPEELHKILKKTIQLLLDSEIVFVETVKMPKVRTKRNVCSALSLSICEEDTSCKISKGRCLLAIEKAVYEAFVERLAIEIIWNKDILNGRIIPEFYGENKFIKRKNEVILLNEQEIQNYFHKK